MQKFKERPVLNIGRWTEPHDGDNWIPTKQGIAFSIEHLTDLIAALQEAEDHARVAGLIEDETEAAVRANHTPHPSPNAPRRSAAASPIAVSATFTAPPKLKKPCSMPG